MFIRNVIFDLGEVIIPLDFDRMVKNFEALGLARFDEFYKKQKAALFDPFELGKISAAQFRQALRTHFDLSAVVSDQHLDEAWNSWLGELSKGRLACIRKLKEEGAYRLFLFSNTNPIHLEEIYRRYGKDVFKGCFEKEFYSFKLGQKKPNHFAFTSIINSEGLRAQETVHIDDTLEHLDGARLAGLQVIHVAAEPKRDGLTTVESVIEAISFIEATNRSFFLESELDRDFTPPIALIPGEQAKKSFFSGCLSLFKCCYKAQPSRSSEEHYQYLPESKLSL